MQVENTTPTVLCFGGLDPTGGAGLQADIESVAACGGHALSIATCLTVQDSTRAYAFVATGKDLIQQQADALLADIAVDACKIGVIPNSEVATVVAGIIAQIANIPVVLDPVLRATAGSTFCDRKTMDTLKKALLPLTTVITPNAEELLQLSSNQASPSERANELCKLGPEYALVTDANHSATEVCNTLFQSGTLLEEYLWPKLPYVFHGSGCTLSSALACFLSKQTDVRSAVQLAQEFTRQSLQSARTLGKGQKFPKRIHLSSA